MIYIFTEKFEKLKIVSPRVKTQPFQFGLTNVTCVTPVPISNSIFHIDARMAANFKPLLGKMAAEKQPKSLPKRDLILSSKAIAFHQVRYFHFQYSFNLKPYLSTQLNLYIKMYIKLLNCFVS